jgi:hypothetical protein
VSASHLQAEPKAPPRPIYFAAPDAEGCFRAPNTQSVFLALWGLRYCPAAVFIMSAPKGAVTGLSEAEALWWVETRMFELGLLKDERLARYVAARAERDTLRMARAA